ncbi:GyrI-like domain-containing protein [Tessaracoccus caeni]|uniref:GyrI-like domain-containing protein n=1 Tax=Tessaracoccus caeni TaxID=3031239 RepID=UPI0023D9F600|nr:GyrI-like domain-containing protein [Tessaracoccus caeni]MDF1488653.1 GyrI-like domain-containing protein [Tessaracoccus caeni]
MTELIQLPEQRILFVRGKVPTSELPAFQGQAFQAIWSVLDPAQAIAPAHPHVRYYLVSADEMDVEVSVPVTDDATGNETVKIGALPGGTAVTCLHVGSHQGLGSAYGALASAETGDLSPNGPPWEVYEWIAGDKVLSSESWSRPDEWRTLLVQPLA